MGSRWSGRSSDRRGGGLLRVHRPLRTVGVDAGGLRHGSKSAVGGDTIRSTCEPSVPIPELGAPLVGRAGCLPRNLPGPPDTSHGAPFGHSAGSGPTYPDDAASTSCPSFGPEAGNGPHELPARLPCANPRRPDSRPNASHDTQDPPGRVGSRHLAAGSPGRRRLQARPPTPGQGGPGGTPILRRLRARDGQRLGPEPVLRLRSQALRGLRPGVPVRGHRPAMHRMPGPRAASPTRRQDRPPTTLTRGRTLSSIGGNRELSAL